MKSLSLSAHLTANNELIELFSRSNLCRSLTTAIRNGSLYLPPYGEMIESVWLHRGKGTLASGVNGKYNRVEFGVTTASTDEDGDEQTHHHTCTVWLPTTLVDGYTVNETAPEFANDKMVFAYPKRAFRAWIKEQRDQLVKDRAENLTEQITSLTTELKALTRKGAK